DLVVQPARQRPDVLLERGGAQCRPDRLVIRRLRQAEAHVRPHRVVEQHDVLAYQSDLGAQVGQPELVQRNAVEQDPAPVGSMKRGSRFTSVVLPAPEVPTRATTSPGRTSRSMSTSAGASLPG